jgi:hypothetical protein
VANTAWYRPDPSLYGLMEVHAVREDGMVTWVTCRVDPERDGVPTYELFDAEQLEITVRFEVAA